MRVLRSWQVTFLLVPLLGVQWGPRQGDMLPWGSPTHPLLVSIPWGPPWSTSDCPACPASFPRHPAWTGFVAVGASAR